MRHSRVSLLFSLAGPFALAGIGLAQISEGAIDALEGRLRSYIPGTGALFGHSVAIRGSTCVVGAPLDDNVSGIDAGTAYVFERTGTQWSGVALLLGSAASDIDLVGNSVAIGEDAIVVGSYLDDPMGFNAAGSAYVFVRCGDGWIEAIRLVHPDPRPGDQFGFKVAIDGSTVVVGSPADDTGEVDGGSVLVFDRDDNDTPGDPCDDTWTLTAELTPSFPQLGASFGTSLAIRGSRIVVGAPAEDSPKQNAGAVYLFEQNADVWSETCRLLAPDAAIDDQFGGAVAVETDILLVGASLNDQPQSDRGSVYSFNGSSGAWVMEAGLVADDGDAFDGFGSDVAIEGDMAIVGAPGDDDAGSSSGSAYLFRRTGSTWMRDQKLTASDAAENEEFGNSVAIEGGAAVVGSHRDDFTLPNSGSASVFLLSRGNFQRFGFGDGGGTACPCGNASRRGLEQGCANSTGWGGKASIAGTDSASADDLRVIAWNLIPANAALLYTGLQQIDGGAGMPFGNGLRLVGGPIVRRGVIAPDDDGRAIWGPALGGAHPWVTDSTVHFQVWYRDPFHDGCGWVFNLTNGVSVTFRP